MASPGNQHCANFPSLLPWVWYLTFYGTRCIHDDVNVNVNVNVEFKVTLHEQVRYRGTLQY